MLGADLVDGGLVGVEHHQLGGLSTYRPTGVVGVGDRRLADARAGLLIGPFSAQQQILVRRITHISAGATGVFIASLYARRLPSSRAFQQREHVTRQS